MLNRIRKPLSSKETMSIVSLFIRLRKMLAIFGMLGVIWSSGPMQYLNALTATSDNNESYIIEEMSKDKDGKAKYPYTTDQEFDPSLVDIQMEVDSKRTANTKTFRKIDGTYEVAVYNDVIHFLDNGKWKQINNSLQDIGEDFETRDNRFKLKFPKKLDDKKDIKLSMGDYRIDWNVMDLSKSDIEFDETFGSPTNIKELTNINQTVLYRNVQPNVDIEYVVTGSQVKENIILNQYVQDFSMTFNYELKDLSLIEDQDGNIVFLNQQNEVVFVFSDLFMHDNELDQSYNIDFKLIDKGNGTYEITITPSDEWLKNAQYPVQIDPSIVVYPFENTGLNDKYVWGSSQSSTANYNKTGLNNTLKYRSYIELDMSIVPDDSMITFAHLRMQLYGTSNTCPDKCTVVAKEVYNYISFSSIIGQELNITEDRIIDYEVINNEDGSGENYTWDISRNFQEWVINGDTSRILELRRLDESASGYIYFQSSEYNGYTGPTVEVGYQYIAGVKDFWTYNEQPVGPAGTGFVSDYTGQLNFARQDLNYYTDLQSLELSFVYNTNFKDLDVGYGNGWLTNYNIEVHKDNDAGQYYTTDATGGKVWYVRHEENLSESCDARFAGMTSTYCYLAEDGSRNMLVVTESDGPGAEPDISIMLVTLDQIYYEFNSKGYLNKIRDKKHNTEVVISLELIEVAIGNFKARIDKITDTTGNYIELTYVDGNSDGDYKDIEDYLDEARLYVKTGSTPTPTYNLLKYTKYIFDTTSNPGDRLLDEVKLNVDYNDDGVFKNEHIADYSYDSNNRLLEAETVYIDDQQQLINAGKVVYSYNSNKVQTISNFYNGSEFGNVTYDYEYRKTTITNHLDEEIYYLFDVYGHTVQVMNDDGLLQSFKYLNIFSNSDYDVTYEGYYEYLRNYRLNHQLVYKSDPEISFLDPILNSSFESSPNDDAWTFGIDDMGGATATGYASHQYTTNVFVYGGQSARLYYYDNSMESHLRQVITVDSGSYKLQGYVKNNGTSNNAYFRIEGASSEGGNSSFVPNDGEWHYIELSFGASVSNQLITIKLMNAAHGDVYFDSMQVVEGFRNTRSNLFDNSSFEATLNGWVFDSAYKSDYNFATESIYTEILGSSGLRIDGNPYDLNGASTDITSIVGTTEGDHYTINLWGYSMGTPYKKHSDDGNVNTFDQESYMRAKITYTDSLTNVVADPTYITFDQQIEGWQKLSTEFEIPSGVAQVQIELEYLGLGYVFFDGLTIESEKTGTTYLVNEAGNIEQIVTSSSEVTTLNHEEDSNGNPVSSTPSKINTVLNNTEIPLNDNFLPEYYENNNVRITPTYDSYGRTTLEKYGDNTNYFSTSTTFDTGTFSQFKEVTTNEFGKSTTYDYDVVTGLLQSIQNAKGDTIEYEYYDDGLLHKVLNNGYCDVVNPTECAYTEYVYDDSNRLIKIVMETGYYYFIDYDPEGRMETVYVKNDSDPNDIYSNLLMSYDYYKNGSSNQYETNKILTQTYGNGDLIMFTYDVEDRVKEVQYGNSPETSTTRFSYEYDQRGQIAVFNTHDSSGQIIEVEYYSYDISGRLLSVTDNEGNRIEYKYDDEGNLKKLEFDILGKTQSVSYDHNEELPIDRDDLDEQIFGNYDLIWDSLMEEYIVYQSDATHEYNNGTTSIEMNTTASDPSFGGVIEVMPSSNYTVDMNLISTTYNVRLQVYEYSDNPFESGNYVKLNLGTYSSAIGPRSLEFTTGATTKYIIVSVYSGLTADFEFDSLTLDYDGPDETSLYDQTTFTTQDLQNVIKNYNYEDNALFRLDFINLQNGTFSMDQDFEYNGNTTRISEIEYRIDNENNGFSTDSPDNDVKIEYVYYYDDLGNIEKVYYKLNGSTKTYEYYEYDEMNQIVLEDHRDYTVSCTVLSDTCYTIIYKYDLRGNITDIKYYPYGERETIDPVIPAFNHFNNGLNNAVMNYNGSNDYQDIYSINVGETPSLTFSYYDEVSQSYILGMTTTLTYSNVNSSIAGYYYMDYNATNNAWYDLDFRIVVKVGNPQSVENYPTRHIEYNYSTNWLDQLSNYEVLTYNSNGIIASQTTAQSYTYDNQGNPISITNFLYNGVQYDHATLEYDGRQLRLIEIFDGSSNNDSDLAFSIDYTYNDQGYRTSKRARAYDYVLGSLVTTSDVTTEYHLQGDRVLLETDGTSAIIYTYDYDGKLISFNYDLNKNDTTKGIEYYYIRNQQGDITKIVDKNGTIVVEYMYDAYGKLLEIEGALASTIGEMNPYRYRGYRYDSEIEMYYLNSRFYDANIGRFINADGLFGAEGNTLGHNVYSYTQNNPVMLTDSTGYYSEFTSFITNQMYNHIYSYFKLKGLKHIASGEVKYNGEDEIRNSYMVQDLGSIIIYSYYLAEQSEYSGNFDSGGGIASEWIVHNIIYDVAYVPNKIFGWGSEVKRSSKHLGVGPSVFDELDYSLDPTRDDRLERFLVFSASYSVEYILFRGDAYHDLYEYLRGTGVE